ncbi:MAG TPA: PilZ domain-containing protein [Polyangiaceae bacterium LLY-WYZ-15_(1-7)]|nr:PilZ domain-containing protein [Polyangiaceae bacterium LLY-WYZ-15_(1-7)]HJL07463.1 PilZ domain-containing protein [Polyangiaceae bacterium LLY-WYZ-15_(1-7)]HJL35882.1 PilZ domain-containing protein [Polyangiaceae bacterium LLY-WYZ-15_(1-7)]HJL45546.1 PilZ domain-containing protein [Polyangiaceae bacterium LLY-WYZ-15_(1-7)]
MRVFDFVHDHQRLLARAELAPLDPAERTRLDELTRLLGGQATDAPADRRAMPRIRCVLPVRLVTLAGVVEGVLRDLSGGGFRIETTLPIARGECVAVHLRIGSRRYAFPARVVWSTGHSAGVALAGVPQRERARGAA